MIKAKVLGVDTGGAADIVIIGASALVNVSKNAASSAMLLPLALIVDRPWNLSISKISIWAAVLGPGAFSTAVAYLFYFRILASSGATNILLVTFLVPVSAPSLVSGH